MSLLYGTALVVAIVLFVYLLYAILQPEKFG